MELFIQIYVVDPMIKANIEDTPENRFHYAHRQYEKAFFDGTYEELMHWYQCVRILSNDYVTSTN